MVTELKLTEEQILEHIQKKGKFSLTWHYRVNKTRDVCEKMVRKGLLRVIRSNRGVDVWVRGLNSK